VLLEIVIETDGLQESEDFQTFGEQELNSITREKAIKALLEGGLWPSLRQRPFSKIANPSDKPKSIFVHAMNTEPLALDVDIALENKEREFQAGLNVIKSLTDGEVHLCTAADTKSKVLTEAKNVQIHSFSGPHPTGNVSTHIQHVDPINKGDLIWYLEAHDVARIGLLFLNGHYPVERIIAITGEGAKNKTYAKTIEGAPFSLLLQGSSLEGMCCISGSVLTGRNVGPNGFVHFYDSQITVIPQGGKRELLGWLVPGFNKYTFSHTYASAFFPKKEYSLSTDTHGGDRAIVLNHIYDSLISLDIMTYFLLKAVISGEVEEAEKLGILECDAEDFALCDFACPSKMDISGIIRKGLEVIEKEG